MISIKKIFVLFSVVLISLSAASQNKDTLRISNDMYMLRLTDFVYLYNSTKEIIDQGKVSANGIVVIVGRKAIIVDTPWDDAHTATLCAYIRDSLKTTIQLVVITHAHDDRIGGIAEIKRSYISVYASEATTLLAKQEGLPRPDIIFTDSLQLNFNGENILLFFPGAGHSSDNIVVWIPSEKLLYGGCFVKDYASINLGNMTDANTEAWGTSMKKLISRFTEAYIIVPGHGSPGGPELLEHTLKLIETYKKP